MKILRIQWEGAKTGNLEFRDTYKEWQVSVEKMLEFANAYESWMNTGMPLGGKLVVDVKNNKVDPTILMYNFTSVKQVMLCEVADES